MALKYWFKIGRDYSTEKEFLYPVTTVEEAVLVENIFCCITNDKDNLLGIEDSIGGLIQLDQFSEYEDYYDNDTFEDFDEKKESMTNLQDKRPNKIETEKIVKAFISYINNTLNYRFFFKIVLAKLEPKQ
jgi:hypothetical protein